MGERAADQARNIVLHNGFASLILHPLTITYNPTAPRGYRFRLEHFDLDLNRIADFDGAKKTHLVQAGERHARPMYDSGLHRQTLGHAEGQASRRDALAIETFLANVF